MLPSYIWKIGSESREIRGRDKFSRQDFLHPLYPILSGPSERSWIESKSIEEKSKDIYIYVDNSTSLVVETKLADLSPRARYLYTPHYTPKVGEGGDGS